MRDANLVFRGGIEQNRWIQDRVTSRHTFLGASSTISKLGSTRRRAGLAASRTTRATDGDMHHCNRGGQYIAMDLATAPTGLRWLKPVPERPRRTRSTPTAASWSWLSSRKPGRFQESSSDRLWRTLGSADAGAARRSVAPGSKKSTILKIASAFSNP